MRSMAWNIAQELAHEDGLIDRDDDGYVPNEIAEQLLEVPGVRESMWDYIWRAAGGVIEFEEDLANTVVSAINREQREQSEQAMRTLLRDQLNG